jgi:hypothetical protein
VIEHRQEWSGIGAPSHRIVAGIEAVIDEASCASGPAAGVGTVSTPLRVTDDTA